MSALFDFKDVVARNRMLGLWRILRNYRRAYVVAFVCVCVAAIARSLPPLLIGYFADQVVTAGKIDPYMLVGIAVGFVAFSMVEAYFTFTSGRLAARAAEGTALDLRNYLLDHLQRLPFTFYDRSKTGDLIQRVTSDIEAIRRFFSDQFIVIGRIILRLTVTLTVMLMLDWPLALLSIVTMPVILALTIFFFRRISKLYNEYQDQEGKLSSTLQENLTGVRIVKAFARQPYEVKKFDQDNLEKMRRGKLLMLMHSLYWPLADIVSWSQLLTGIAAGAWLAIHGQISLGTFLAYIALVGQVIWPLRDLGRLLTQMSSGLVSYGRVAEVIAERREALTEGDTRPTGRVRGDLTFENLTFEYEKGKPVLNDISFRVNAGETVALLGSTGSGKTTLVNLLPRFYDYTSGSIKLDGVELNRYPRHYLRQQIGSVEQEPFLFSRTIRENITYGLDRTASDAEVEAAARAAAIHDVILSFPKGYDTLVGEKGVTLSGGQKQRVALARTLLINPSILILDDATSSVDTETESDIREALKQLMHNRTTFIIAHRIQSVMIADLILVLDKGRIVQSGSHDELMLQPEPNIYRRIYNLQSQVELELEKEIASV